MNAERSAFYESIRESLDDDTPRLVFADWLEERGEAERAEFIRVQCALAKDDIDYDELDRLRQRESELWQTFGHHWTSELPQIPGITWSYFERGFVGCVTINHWQDWFAALPGLWDQSPITTLQIRSHGEQPEPLAAMERLSRTAAEHAPSRLRGLALALNDEWITESLCRLFRDGHFIDLQSFHCNAMPTVEYLLRHPDFVPGMRFWMSSGAQIGDTEGRWFGSNTRWTELRRLVAGGCDLGKSVQNLWRSPTFARLRHLELYSNHIESGMVTESPPELPSLQYLDLSGNNIGDNGIIAIARKGHLPELTSLRVANCSMGAMGFRSLLTTSWLPSLRELDIARNEVGDKGMEYLRGLNASCSLTSLDLERNQLSPKGIKDLIAWPGLNGVVECTLDRNHFGDDGIIELVRWTGPCALRSLSLGQCGIGRGGMELLTRWPILDQLRELRLNDNRLRSMGFRELLKSPYVSNLRRLHLANTHLDDDDIHAMIDSGALDHLRYLDLQNNNFDFDTIDRAREHFAERLSI